MRLHEWPVCLEVERSVPSDRVEGAAARVNGAAGLVDAARGCGRPLAAGLPGCSVSIRFSRRLFGGGFHHAPAGTCPTVTRAPACRCPVHTGGIYSDVSWGVLARDDRRGR